MVPEIKKKYYFNLSGHQHSIVGKKIKIPDIAEEGFHLVVQYIVPQPHAGLKLPTVVPSMQPGSDQDETPSGKTVGNN